MRIAGIKFKQGGLKGIEITYRQTEINNRFEYDDEFSVKKKRPIHSDFKKAMQAFEKHLRNICGVNDEKVNIDITGVYAGEDNVQVMGNLKLFSNLCTQVNTPVICEDDEYIGWDDLNTLVDKLYKECLEYISNGKSTSAKQYTLDLMQEDPKFFEKKELSASDIKKMDEEGSYELMKEYLEKKGAIVLMMDEPNGEEDHEAKVIEIPVNQEEQTEENPFSKKKKKVS